MNYKTTQTSAQYTKEVDDWILNYGSAYLKKVYSDREANWFDIYASERQKTDYPGWTLIKDSKPLPTKTEPLTKREQTLWEKHPESSFSENGCYLVINRWLSGYNLKKHITLLHDQSNDSGMDYYTVKVLTFWSSTILEIFLIFAIFTAIADKDMARLKVLVCLPLPIKLLYRAADTASINT